MNAGQPQRYGIMGDCAGPGRRSPRPIEDKARLEDLRKAAALPPITQYVAERDAACR